MRGKLFALSTLLLLSIICSSCVVSTTDIMNTGKNDSILSGIAEDNDKAQYYINSLTSAYTSQHNVGWRDMNEGDHVTVTYSHAPVSISNGLEQYDGAVSGTVSFTFPVSSKYEITYSLRADDGSFSLSNSSAQDIIGFDILNFITPITSHTELSTLQNTDGVSRFTVERNIAGSFSADDSNGYATSFNIDRVNIVFSASSGSNLTEKISINANNGAERVFVAASRSGSSSGYTINEFFIEPFDGSGSSGMTITDDTALKILNEAVNSFPRKDNESWNDTYNNDRIQIALENFSYGSLSLNGIIESDANHIDSAMLYDESKALRVYVSDAISGGTANPSQFVQSILYTAASALKGGKTQGIKELNMTRSAEDAGYKEFFFDGSTVGIKDFQIIRTKSASSTAIEEKAKLRILWNGADISINAKRNLSGNYTITYQGAI